MSNPILMVVNGGMGETPVPADALLKPGDVLNVHDTNDGSQRPAKVIAVVPVGVSEEIAIADQTGVPRPLMLTKPRHKEPLYVLEWEGKQFRVKHEKVRKGLDRAQAAGLNDEAPT